MPSDAVLAALREAVVPGEIVVRDFGDRFPTTGTYENVRLLIADELDRIGLVAAVHGGPAAKRAMLRTLLQQWRFENDDQLSIDVEVAVDDILSLLAPEAPTEDDDGR